MGHLIGKAELLNGSRTVAAADDADRAGLGKCSCHSLGALCEGFKLENAHGAVPNDGLCVFDCVGEKLNGLGADVHTHPAVGDSVNGNYLLLAGDYESADIVPLMTEMFEFIRDFEGEIPGASAKDCGNYLDMNLGMAKYLADKYLREVLYDIRPERLIYPE